ncbi:hypothetical protein IW262DRAFT_1281659 [Armillaria fumosa]|nr:hypothetical protein IW262DRAFT_1281659 [Armillaria fumosa]
MVVNAHTGAGVWYGANDSRNRVIRLTDLCQTNNAGEIWATLERAQAETMNITIQTFTDSKYILDRLCCHLTRWEDRG